MKHHGHAMSDQTSTWSDEVIPGQPAGTAGHSRHPHPPPGDGQAVFLLAAFFLVELPLFFVDADFSPDFVVFVDFDFEPPEDDARDDEPPSDLARDDERDDEAPEELEDDEPDDDPPLAAFAPPDFFSLAAETERRRASMRSSTSASSPSSRSPKVPTVSTASPCSSFASTSVRSCSWYSSTNSSGWKSPEKFSTSAEAISSSLALIRTSLSMPAKSGSRTSSSHSRVWRTMTSSRTRSAPSWVRWRRVKDTIAVRSVSSSVRRSSA